MHSVNLACIVGARPNFMKMAPLLRAFDSNGSIESTLIHTGQHYDANLSDVFFEELGIRKPDYCLNVGSGKQGVQTARLIEKLEEVLEKGDLRSRPFDRLLVVGDVNSTMAAAIAAAKLCIPVAHVEAGLRSFDRSMPEEINRLVTDAISDMLLVSEPSGVEHLRSEGHAEDDIHLVGNVMIDTLLALLPTAQSLGTLGRMKLRPGEYGVVTLHRPSNVDSEETLSRLLDALIDLSQRLPLVFAVHPRTRVRAEKMRLAGRLDAATGLLSIDPLGYLDFLALTSQARVIVTDSGGLQEESTALGVPCLTMRANTERPITVTEGTSTLIGDDVDLLRKLFADVLDGKYKTGHCPELWDGHAAERIRDVLVGCDNS